MSLSICGLDECGRGAFAGPLVAAGVVIDTIPQKIIESSPIKIRDSKKLNKIQRLQLFEFIKSSPIRYKIDTISVSQINKYGISWANKIIFSNLINQIEAQKYIVDGNINFTSHKKSALIQSQVKADDLVLEVMLSSIIAKVTRDSIMSKLHISHPHYQWHQNAGYGTLFHRKALIKYGSSSHHRQLFIHKTLMRAKL